VTDKLKTTMSMVTDSMLSRDRGFIGESSLPSASASEPTLSQDLYAFSRGLENHYLYGARILSMRSLGGIASYLVGGLHAGLREVQVLHEKTNDTWDTSHLAAFGLSAPSAFVETLAAGLGTVLGTSLFVIKIPVSAYSASAELIRQGIEGEEVSLARAMHTIWFYEDAKNLVSFAANLEFLAISILGTPLVSGWEYFTSASPQGFLDLFFEHASEVGGYSAENLLGWNPANPSSFDRWASLLGTGLAIGIGARVFKNGEGVEIKSTDAPPPILKVVGGRGFGSESVPENSAQTLPVQETPSNVYVFPVREVASAHSPSAGTPVYIMEKGLAKLVELESAPVVQTHVKAVLETPPLVQEGTPFIPGIINPETHEEAKQLARLKEQLEQQQRQLQELLGYKPQDPILQNQLEDLQAQINSLNQTENGNLLVMASAALALMKGGKDSEVPESIREQAKSEFRRIVGLIDGNPRHPKTTARAIALVKISPCLEVEKQEALGLSFRILKNALANSKPKPGVTSEYFLPKEEIIDLAKGIPYLPKAEQKEAFELILKALKISEGQKAEEYPFSLSCEAAAILVEAVQYLEGSDKQKIIKITYDLLQRVILHSTDSYIETAALVLAQLSPYLPIKQRQAALAQAMGILKKPLQSFDFTLDEVFNFIRFCRYLETANIQTEFDFGLRKLRAYIFREGRRIHFEDELNRLIEFSREFEDVNLKQEILDLAFEVAKASRRPELLLKFIHEPLRPAQKQEALEFMQQSFADLAGKVTTSVEVGDLGKIIRAAKNLGSFASDYLEGEQRRGVLKYVLDIMRNIGIKVAQTLRIHNAGPSSADEEGAWRRHFTHEIGEAIQELTRALASNPQQKSGQAPEIYWEPPPEVVEKLLAKKRFEEMPLWEKALMIAGEVLKSTPAKAKPVLPAQAPQGVSKSLGWKPKIDGFSWDAKQGIYTYKMPQGIEEVTLGPDQFTVSAPDSVFSTKIMVRKLEDGSFEVDVQQGEVLLKGTFLDPNGFTKAKLVPGDLVDLLDVPQVSFEFQGAE